MAKKKRRSKPGRPRKTKRTELSSATLADLQAEIERRESMVQELSDRRKQLAAELDEIDRELASHGAPARRRPGRPRGSGVRRGPGRPRGSATGARRGRPAGRRRNKTNLVEALKQVLTGKTMSVTEVSEAVQKAGYRTTSANFRTIVNQALITNPDVFRKVARGQYTAK